MHFHRDDRLVRRDPLTLQRLKPIEANSPPGSYLWLAKRPARTAVNLR